jgi:hypothetical protein
MTGEVSVYDEVMRLLLGSLSMDSGAKALE